MPKVTIYTTTTCPYCHMEKSYLKSKGVKFEDIVLDKNPDKVPEFRDTCGSMGVPCTHIIKDDGTQERILGFDMARLDSVLGLG